MFRFMKTKRGFTLTELLVVVAIVGIIVCVAIPVYNGFTKSARQRNCSAERLKAKAQAESWCKDNFFNADYIYDISSDGTSGTITANPSQALNEGDIALLRDSIHEGDVPCCPSGGTMTIEVTPRSSGVPKITVTCDGGKDGDTHKDEK